VQHLAMDIQGDSRQFREMTDAALLGLQEDLRQFRETVANVFGDQSEIHALGARFDQLGAQMNRVEHMSAVVCSLFLSAEHMCNVKIGIQQRQSISTRAQDRAVHRWNRPYKTSSGMRYSLALYHRILCNPATPTAI